METAEAEVEETKKQYHAAVADRSKLREESEALRREMKGMEGEYQKLKAEKEQLGKSQGQLAGYGRQIENLCWEIKKAEKRFKQVPLGPLGLHVAVRPDAQEWAGPVENAIGAAINNFVVTCHEDRQLLQDMCRRCDCGHFVNIVTMPASQGKHRVREPNDRRIKSVAQSISVEEPAIWNALVDWAKIDTSAVFKTHQEADRAIIRNGGALWLPAG